jgi:uncharacterized protein GlcG (DUF336 family)
MFRSVRGPAVVWGGIVAVGLAVAVIFSTASRPVAAQDKPQDRAGSAPQPGKAADTKDITLDQAHAALAAAQKKADELHIKQDIAIVDAGGNLKAFARMDGAWLGSIDIAQKKARTARYFDMPSGEIGKLSQPGKPLYMIEISNGGLITFPGGVPIKTQDDVIIGAIGVSGSTVENDQACAEAGASAVK